MPESSGNCASVHEGMEPQRLRVTSRLHPGMSLRDRNMSMKEGHQLHRSLSRTSTLYARTRLMEKVRSPHFNASMNFTRIPILLECISQASALSTWSNHASHYHYEGISMPAIILTRQVVPWNCSKPDMWVRRRLSALKTNWPNHKQVDS